VTRDGAGIDVLENPFGLKQAARSRLPAIEKLMALHPQAWAQMKAALRAR
jgi:hypothetical protein